MKKLLLMALVILLAITVMACTKSENTSQSEPVKMARADLAPHGDKGFATIVVSMQGNKIVGVSLDEYQFLSKDVITAGVPNSEALENGGFGSNYKDPGVVLASKRVNSDFYSNLMKEKAGSTVTIAENFNAIENFCVGKTIDEVKKVAEGEGAVDAVSGATLADTAGYLKAVVQVAEMIQ